MSQDKHIKPSQEAVEAAKKQPNGWVYQIDKQYNCAESIPPEAIVGAWKVDALGNIVGEFLPNPNYRSKN